MLNIVKYICGIILSISLGIALELNAQNVISGQVKDDVAQPIAQVQISVNGSENVLSNDQGRFSVDIGVAERPEVLRATFKNYKIQDWKFQNSQLIITMALPKTIKGRVLSTRRVPIAGINVLMFGIKGLEAVQSNAEGFFEMEVPRSTPINEKSRFIVYDPGRLKGTANFEIEMRDNMPYLFVDIPALPVTRVELIHVEGEGLANTPVMIDGQRYIANSSGTFNPQGVNSQSSFKVEGFIIQKFEYDEVASLMKLQLRSPLAGESASQKAISSDEDKKVAIVTAYDFLIERQEEVESEIDVIEERLRSGENISAAQRAKLLADLKRLREESTFNQKEIFNVLEAARLTIDNLEDRIDKEKQNTKETQQKLDVSEREKELAQERVQLQNDLATRNWIIFLIIAVALISIATIFFLNNRKVRAQKDDLSEKVSEINQKNEMLEESATIMDVKNKQINEKNDQLIQQTQELEEKNKHITDSIRYAQTIQQSILPSISQMKDAIPELFVFFQPKDIVSGDFYWFTQRGDEVLIAAADCTGHGVPGAFMTMMGNAILNQVVNEQGVNDPSEILSLLHSNVQANLKRQSSNGLRDGDGMDISLLRLNLKEKTACFAGAKNPLYLMKDGELMYLKGTNISIGSTLKKTQREFQNRNIDLSGGETFYLVSDGFQDQLGGTENGKPRKKFMKTRFINLLEKASSLSIEEQQELLSQEFNQWKGEHDQTDDVLIIGFKYHAETYSPSSSSSIEILK